MAQDSSLRLKTIFGFDALCNLLVFILCILFFGYIWFNVHTDIQAHAKALKAVIDGQASFPANFLYFYTAYFFSGFTIEHIWIGSTIALSIAVLLKFIVSKQIISDILVTELANKEFIINTLALFLLIVFNLPNPFIYLKFHYVYIGSFAPSVWHNSTTIFVMPFVLLLFRHSYKQLQEYSFKRLAIIALLIFVNILIKPSFVFVFAIAYPILLIITHKLSKKFWINILPIIIAIVLVFIEYLLIYQGSANTSNTGITIKPFQILRHYAQSENLLHTTAVFLTSIVCSFLFPIIYMIKHRRKSFDLFSRYAVLCLIIALAISQLLSETGARENSGNFSWQVIMCSYITFLIFSAKLFLNIIDSKWDLKKYKVELSAFSLHLLFGGLYILRYIIINAYK